MKARVVAGIALALFAAASNAALLSRAGGQAYYDTVLDITWLANANLADTNDFGVAGINANGTMTWAKANEWIAAMNTASYLGYSDWRLPTTIDTGTAGCNFAFTGTDCGYNVDVATGEMAHLFYSTLGNLSHCSTGGSCPQPGGGLTNTGPFSNLQSDYYWSDTSYAPNSIYAWRFYFHYGLQSYDDKNVNGFYAWAVRSGDTAEAPVPGALWMFGPAVALMGALRRRMGNRAGK